MLECKTWQGPLEPHHLLYIRAHSFLFAVIWPQCGSLSCVCWNHCNPAMACTEPHVNTLCNTLSLYTQPSLSKTNLEHILHSLLFSCSLHGCPFPYCNLEHVPSCGTQAVHLTNAKKSKTEHHIEKKAYLEHVHARKNERPYLRCYTSHMSVRLSISTSNNLTMQARHV